MPASIDGVVVSEMVEDLATNTVLAIAKFHEQLAAMHWVIAIEAMLAAQAVDLRREIEPGLALAGATGLVRDTVRQVTPMLTTDRTVGPDASAVHERLWQPDCVNALRSALDQRH